MSLLLESSVIVITIARFIYSSLLTLKRGEKNDE